jgi:hypothetical protein
MTDDAAQAFGGHQTRETLLDVVLDKLQKSGKVRAVSRSLSQCRIWS